MSEKFRKLLSPYVIGKTVFKNRIEATTSEPHYLNGPEKYPNDAVVAHYRDKAKGAAIVNVTGLGEDGATTRYPEFIPMTQFPDYDVYDLRNANQFIRLTDTIHFYQSIACATLDWVMDAREFSIGEYHFSIPKADRFDTLTEEEAHNIEKLLIKQSMACKRVGFDMVSIHCAYGRTLLAQSISPLYNHRKDKYGGSIEKRIVLLKGICEGIKKMCGQDFLVHILISAEEDAGGNTLDDTIEILHALEGYVDIVQVRGSNADLSHPTGFEEEVPFLSQAAAIKASGVKMAVESVGGFFDPETCEKAISSGAVDFVGMARSWISNPNYGELLYSGKTDEIVPCIRCNKCHTYSLQPPFRCGCSVNPWIGLQGDRDVLPIPAAEKKRIAVVGGGPGGMKAALIAADRGHDVTIYEASGQLGGQLKHADAAAFKWPLRKFKDYLIRQIQKRTNIEVILNDAITPVRLEKMNYDVVFACIGSRPVIPNIPGIADYALPAQKVYENEKQLGHHVAVIGAGEIGAETAMYLSQCGHVVTVLELRDKLAADMNPVHYRTNFEEAWKREEKNITLLLSAKVITVKPGAVEYRDAANQDIRIVEADSIVVATGMRPDREGALAFAECAPGFALVGDVADWENNLLFTMESALHAASRF